MFVAITLERLSEDKQRIDDLIDRMNNSRVKYILRSNDAYQRTLRFLEGTDEDTKKAVLRHRFYFEIKKDKVIQNDKF